MSNLYLLSYKKAISEDIYKQNTKISNEYYQKSRKKIDVEQDFINTAVHIAAAITSYARIYMHDFKNLKNNSCYYSDTDSVFLKKPLPDNHISYTKLGKLKLEAEKIDCIFLAPKIFIYKQKDKHDVVKFKGVNKENLTYINWESFYKFYSNSETYKYKRKSSFLYTIIPQRVYTKDFLMSSSFTFQKRQKILNYQNKWIDTKPLSINDITIKNNFFTNLKNMIYSFFSIFQNLYQ